MYIQDWDKYNQYLGHLHMYMIEIIKHYLYNKYQ